MATDAIAWLCKETTTTTGTGPYTTSGVAASADYSTFTDVLDDGDRILYAVHSDGSNFEIVEGVWTEATKQLSRLVLHYSTTGALINWGAGTKDIYGIQPVLDTSAFALTANNGSDYDAATFRTNIGLGLAALEAVTKFVVRDGSSTIDTLTAVLNLILQNDGTQAVSLRFGETTGGKQYRLRRTGGVDELRLFHYDGVSAETELLKFTSALITAAKPIELPGDAVTALQAVTKQQLEAAAVSANLTLAAGDEIIWSGAVVPTGYTLQSGADYDDRMILLESTLGQLGDTGGSWTISGLTATKPNVTVNNHTLTVGEMPPHNHDVTIKRTNETAQGGVDVGVDDLDTGGTGLTFTNATDTVGGGGGHNHTASLSAAPTISSNGTWKGKYRKFGVIAKT